MANANTEHSKKLRAQTASAWQKKQIEEGKLKRVAMVLPVEVVELFDEIAKELALSRPQTLKTVLEAFRGSNKR